MNQNFRDILDLKNSWGNAWGRKFNQRDRWTTQTGGSGRAYCDYRIFTTSLRHAFYDVEPIWNFGKLSSVSSKEIHIIGQEFKNHPSFNTPTYHRSVYTDEDNILENRLDLMRYIEIMKGDDNFQMEVRKIPKIPPPEPPAGRNLTFMVR